MQPRVGTNMVMAAVLALLSYVPFETVAKGSLMACVVLFVWDPIPPLTRLLALGSVLVVAALSKLHRQWQTEHELEHGVSIQSADGDGADDGAPRNTGDTNDKKDN